MSTKNPENSARTGAAVSRNQSEAESLTQRRKVAKQFRETRISQGQPFPISASNRCNQKRGKTEKLATEKCACEVLVTRHVIRPPLSRCCVKNAIRSPFFEEGDKRLGFAGTFFCPSFFCLYAFHLPWPLIHLPSFGRCMTLPSAPTVSVPRSFV